MIRFLYALPTLSIIGIFIAWLIWGAVDNSFMWKAAVSYGVYLAILFCFTAIAIFLKDCNT